LPSFFRSRVSRATLVALWLVCPALLRAQDDITAVPNRPSASNPADTTQTGVLEAEYGTDLATTHKDINGLLKFGLTKDLELAVAHNPVVADSAATTTGFGDLGVGFKYRFLHQKGRVPAMAFNYIAKVPTARGDLGSGEVDHTIIFLVSMDFGKHHFDVNTAVNYLGRAQRNGFDTDWANALSWSRPLKGKWGINGEISGVTRQNALIRPQMQTLWAATYNKNQRLVFDIGVVGRIFGDIPDASFLCGVTYSIADLYHHHPRAVKHP
jgi:hypothetical protein